MKLETILNDLVEAEANSEFESIRDRILRMDAEKEDVIAGQFDAIVRQQNTISEKDAEIDKLMELAIVVDRLRKHRMDTDYLDAMDMAKMIVKEYGK